MPFCSSKMAAITRANCGMLKNGIARSKTPHAISIMLMKFLMKIIPLMMMYAANTKYRFLGSRILNAARTNETDAVMSKIPSSFIITERG